MTTFLIATQLNANDDHATLTRWERGHQEKVRKGDIVCTLETTKSSIDIEATTDGYLYHLASPDENIAVGGLIGAIDENPDANIADLRAHFCRAQTVPTENTSKRWTKKAALVANRLGIDIETLARKFPDRTLKESDIMEAAEQTGSLHCNPGVTPALNGKKFSIHRPERILLLGGAAGGGTVALDAIRRTDHQIAVGILDNNKESHGQTVAGVPILGDFSQAHDLWLQGAFDAAIIVFVGDLYERATWYQRLKDAGIAFTNVIDPSVILRPSLNIGEGNLIMGHCYLAANVTIGNNNFLASHNCIEHHNIVGSHCSFGPRCSTSGAVKVGDYVKFGMHVGVEPYLSIGAHSTIASGAIITGNIPENSLVKVPQNYLIREKSNDTHK